MARQDITIITTTDALAAFCKTLADGAFFAIDTEFMREKTYWPILCLIQAAGENGEAIIDPMARGLDLAPLLDLMADEKTTKVFHAARQDMEIFVKLMGAAPAPIFDTQIAAMACGFGDQIGYEPLMRALLNANIDKGSRFTDWARRPLTPAQLSYALSDVTHLRAAYPLLLSRLEKEGRRAWVEEEMEPLRDPALYTVEPTQAWRRLKLRGVRPADMGPLIKLAEWRESEAQSRDIPRARVLKDDALFELARLKPETPDALSKARSISGGLERSRLGAGMLDAIRAGKAMDRKDLPKLERSRPQEPPPADVVEMLKVLLKCQCEKHDVAPRLIASMSDLEALALDPSADIQAMSGWRRDVFGDPAVRLLKGKLAMRLVDGAVDLFDVK